MRKTKLAAAISAMAMTGLASANVSVCQGAACFIPGDAQLENVLFTADQGTTVSGFTNQTNQEVVFSSTTDTLVVDNGASDINALDLSLHHLEWEMANDLLVMEVVRFSIQSSVDQVVSLDWTTVPANGDPTGGDYFVSANATNWFTMFAQPESFGMVTLTSTTDAGIGITDFSHLRIDPDLGTGGGGGGTTTSIPAPGATALLGMGLVGLFRLRRGKVKVRG